MENDVLKNKIAPWQEKGRWYKATFKRNAANTAWEIITEKTDSEGNFTVSGNTATIGIASESVVDVKISFEFNVVSGAGGYINSTQETRYLAGTGTTAFMLMGGSGTIDPDTIIKLWVFKYKV